MKRQVAIEWHDFAQIAEHGWRPAPAFAEAAARPVPREGAGSRYGAVIPCGGAVQTVPADGGNFLPGELSARSSRASLAVSLRPRLQLMRTGQKIFTIR